MDKLKLWEEQVNNLRKILDRKLSFVNCRIASRIASGIDNGELQKVDDLIYQKSRQSPAFYQFTDLLAILKIKWRVFIRLSGLTFL